MRIYVARLFLALVLSCVWFVVAIGVSQTDPEAGTDQPMPLLSKEVPVEWWFAFKFNADTFPRDTSDPPKCLFGGTPGGSQQHYLSKIGQDFVYASSLHPQLQKGSGYLGDSAADPVGATFDEVYNGNLHYVIWNDQFYNDPALQCAHGANQCGAKWAHSKGVVAWDDNGNGFVMQVTTPDWPGSGSSSHPRTEGNSLGCMLSDNDVQLSQDFFSLKLTEADVVKFLEALSTEGAVTDTANPQIVNNGGPSEVVDAVSKLGKANSTATYSNQTLSSGVQLIAKAGGLSVPPWQLVSALLDRAPLRVANFWEGTNLIYSTPGKSKPTCWDKTLGPPGAVQIVTTGTWNGKDIGLSGTAPKGSSLGTNHAKIGVSTAPGSTLTVFGDMNQVGILNASSKTACAVAQNARGGLFFVLDNADLHDSVAALLTGKIAPMTSSTANAHVRSTSPAPKQ